MVRAIVALVLLSLGSLAQAAGLEVRLPGHAPHAAELGRAFTVELHYRGEADLERVPLDAWEDAFAVDRGYVRREANDQRLRLRLIPRRTGTLLLPPLQLGPATSEPLTIQAAPAGEAGEPLEPRWQVGVTDAWQGQELVASLVLDSRKPELRLQTAEPRWPGFAVRALPPVAEALDDGRYRYRITWLLRTLTAGERSLAAPELRLVRNGVPVRRFHFSPASVVVRPAPVYLPPTVPVGRIEQAHDTENPHWLLGHGIPAGLLQAALDRAGLKHRGIAEQRTGQGTLSRARLDWASSRADTARLVYFDQQAGRLRQVDLTAPPPNPALWLLVPAAALAAWLAWQQRRIRRWLARLSTRRLLGLRLAAVDQPRILRATLLVPGQTLDGWLADWQADFHAPPDLAEQLWQLEAVCYGAQAPNSRLWDRLRTAIRHSRPRW